PRSVAAAMGLDFILDQAEEWAEMKRDDGDVSSERHAELREEIEAVRESAFWDRDFESLWEPGAADSFIEMGQPAAPNEEGIPDLLETERIVANQMRYMNLRFGEWFDPFWEVDGQ